MQFSMAGRIFLRPPGLCAAVLPHRPGERHLLKFQRLVFINIIIFIRFDCNLVLRPACPLAHGDYTAGIGFGIDTVFGSFVIFILK